MSKFKAVIVDVIFLCIMFLQCNSLTPSKYMMLILGTNLVGFIVGNIIADDEITE
jgi:uncharacterized membrane protein YqgA involved in biofilm formation